MRCTSGRPVSEGMDWFTPRADGGTVPSSVMRSLWAVRRSSCMVRVRCRYTQLLATQCPPPFCCPPAGGAGQGRAGGGKDESVGDYQERKVTTFLPATSEPGPVALRTPGWVWVPQHQDASVTLEEAYPFMVEGSLRSDGMFVDQDLYSGAVSSTSLGRSIPSGSSPPRIWCWHGSSDPRSHRWRNRSIRGRCRSGNASTCLATSRVNTRGRPK